MEIKGEHDTNLIRLHEKLMTGMERRIEKVETNVNKIPWILLGVVVSSAISMINMIVLIMSFTRSSGAG